jgi:hypothetical protein
MHYVSFNNLTPQEREELALCGISSAAQLQKCTPEQLIHDLRQAQQFFPNRTFTLTEERICRLIPDSAPAEPATFCSETPTLGIPAVNEATPTIGYKFHAIPGTRGSGKKGKRMSEISHRPVRCTHPFLTLIASFSVLFLIIPLLSIIAFPILIVLENMPDIPVELLGVFILVLPWLLYVFFVSRATCPVCHMRIFRFVHYNRNRAAHRLPLLGYNLTTALHVLLLWRYNCPSCGTPVRFTSSRKRRATS